MARICERRGAGLGRPVGDAPSAWTVDFAAGEADAMAARVEADGGAVLVPPF